MSASIMTLPPPARTRQVLAKELVALQPDVILCMGSPATRALQQETSAIPIVFVGVADPIGSGFVASVARPGGNITGFLLFEASITGKWLAMLRNIAPRLARVALAINPKTAVYYEYYLRAAQAAASSLDIELVLTPIENAPANIERAFEAFVGVPNGGLMLPPDTNTNVHRDLIIRLAARHRLPAVYSRPSLRLGRWAHVLRYRPRRPVSDCVVVCRSHPSRRQACRSAGADTDQV